MTAQTTTRDQELATIQQAIVAASKVVGLTNDESDDLLRASGIIRRLRIREMEDSNKTGASAPTPA